MQRFAVLGRFLVTRSSGPRALAVGLPLYFAIGVLATVIFAPSGLDASTVVVRAERSAATRFILLLSWCVGTLPAVRALVSVDTNLPLRTLPLPRWQLIAWLGALILVAELPWFVLWARGGGVVTGVAATLIALALHLGFVARVRTAMDAGLLALTCAAWLGPLHFIPLQVPQGGAGVTSITRIVCGAVAFLIALGRAWQRAPEHRADGLATDIGGSPPLALAVAYSLALFRRHGAALARAAAIVAIGMGWTFLAARNDGIQRGGTDRVLRLAISGWIPSCILAVATPLGPMLRTERAAEWVLDACGTSVIQRRAATTGLAAAMGGAAGLLAGAWLGIAMGSEWDLRWAAMPTLAVAGALLSAGAAICARWAVRDEGADARRLLLALAALIALAEGVLWVSWA